MPIEILMPALSPTMVDGKLSKWVKKEGDKITPGTVIAEIETDKATMEVESIDEGVLGKILIKEGTENVPVNEVIALLLADGESKKDLDSYKPKKPEKKKEEPKAEDVKGDVPGVAIGTVQIATAAPKLAPKPPKAAIAKDGGIKASPLAKRMAEEAGINIENIVGSGPHGRVIKEDVEEAILRGGVGGAVKRDKSEFETISNSTMRKTVAKRLLESKQQVPHFYLTIDCELDRLLDVRKQLNDKAVDDAGKNGKPKYKLSVNDFIIRASAIALKKVPDANASWYDDAIVRYTNVDVSVAVAIEGGLVTPIIKNTDQKSLPQISNEMKELAAKARDNKLKPEEWQGGGFSISNLGMYGIKKFSAIINPPQACILAVGAGEERAVVRNGKIEVANVMSVTLSVDHRAVDGAVGANFLEEFKKVIENPVTMLV